MKELKMFPQIREETEENLLNLEEEPSKNSYVSSTSSSESPPPSSPNDATPCPVLTVTPDDPHAPSPSPPRSDTPQDDLECNKDTPRRVRMRSLSGGSYRLSAAPPTSRMRRQSGDDVLSPTRRASPLFDHFRPRSKSDSKGKRPTFLANLRNTLFSSSAGAQRKTSLEEPLEPLHRQRSGSETRGGTMSKMIDLFRNRSNSLTAESKTKDSSSNSNILLRRRSLEPTKVGRRKQPYNAYRSLEGHQRDPYACHSEDDSLDRFDYSKLAEDKIIPTFLSSRPCYAVMPTSGKVIVLSVELLVKNAFSALVTNDIKAAPLWDTNLFDFVGMLTISDFINVLRHYYYSNPDDIKDIENQSIATWRRITHAEKPIIKINGMESLALASKYLIQESIHRIPVFDEKRQCVLFVLTRKRLLHYLSFTLFENFDKTGIKTPTFFRKTIRELQVGTFEDIATVNVDTKVIEALDLFIKRNVSSLPVIDEKGILKDIFEKFDVFALAKEQTYHNLDMSVTEAITKANVHECACICTLDETLGTVINRFVTNKVHRIVVIDEMRLVVGMISLSDILKFLVLQPLAAMEESGVTSSAIIDEAAEGAMGGTDGGQAEFSLPSSSTTGELSLSEAISNLQISDPKE